MRGSGWLLPTLALLTWIVAIGWPALALILELRSAAPSGVETHPAWELLGTSVGWGGAVALGAMVAGWLPGRLLGRGLQRGGFVVLAALMLAPICLPAYIVFYAWWQSWPADTALHRWIIEHDLMQAARHATLYVGLVCWSWPLVAWCVAGAAAATPPQRQEMLQLDGAPWTIRFLDSLRCDLPGLALGGLLVFLATINNTTCFDLAEVFTYANQMRALEALGANPREVMMAGLPAMVLLLSSAAFIWLMLGRQRREIVIGGRRSARGVVAGAVAIWLLSTLAPLVLFGRNVLGGGSGRAMFQEFFAIYNRSLVTSVGLALIAGCMGAVVTLGLAASWQDHRRWTELLAHAAALGWLFVGVLPGTIIALALEAAYNKPGVSELVFTSPAILVIGYLAAFGFVAALVGRWAAMSEPQEIADLRRLDGAQNLAGWVHSARPRIVVAATAAIAVVFVLALGEIPITAQINPPMRAGSGPLALTLLNDMHYQRPQTVMVAAILMIAGAMLAALGVAIAWRWMTSAFMTQRRRATDRIVGVALLLGLPLAQAACGPVDPENTPPLDPVLVFGSPGQSPAQFGYPRAIDADPVGGFVYVIDKSARVRRFSLDGDFQLVWETPDKDNGKPTGVSVSPDGRVFVPDTHYFRVLAYDSEGNELMRFGEYGTGPGQFIYTTDVAFGPQGNLYVSEYGGHDRVQVFSPNGQYLFEFGSFGSDVPPASEQVQFNRPQSMVFNADQTELFIADACNHRIVVVDPQGKFLRSFGSAGRELGQFVYPYGIDMLEDGTLIVAEFGGNRVQHVDDQGASLGLYGCVGRNQGQLQYPWAVTAVDDRVYILDSGNNRVQVIRSP